MNIVLLVFTVLFGMIFLFLFIYSASETIVGGRAQIENRVKGLEVEKPSKKDEFMMEDEEKITIYDRLKIDSKTRRKIESYEEELFQLGIKMPIQTFVASWAVVTILVPLLLSVFIGFLGSVILMGIIAVAPFLYLKHKRKKRTAELEEQLVDAIGVMINALKAGHSFQSAMSNIAEDMDGPVAQEFGRVFRETQRGMSLEESMTRMVERTGSDDLSIMCTAILIQRQVGGNLSKVLENISATIKERIHLKGEIKTRTSQGRVSGYIVGGIPVLIVLGLSLINPAYMEPMLNTSNGHILLAIGVGMEVVGFFVINKIVDIKY